MYCDEYNLKFRVENFWRKKCFWGVCNIIDYYGNNRVLLNWKVYIFECFLIYWFGDCM